MAIENHGSAFYAPNTSSDTISSIAIPALLPRLPPAAHTRGSGDGISLNTYPYSMRSGGLSSSETVYTYQDMATGAGLESRPIYDPQGPYTPKWQSGASSSRFSLDLPSRFQPSKRASAPYLMRVGMDSHSSLPGQDTQAFATSKYTASALSSLDDLRSFNTDGASTKYTPSVFSFLSISEEASLEEAAINFDTIPPLPCDCDPPFSPPQNNTVISPKPIPKQSASTSYLPQDSDFKLIKHLNLTRKVRRSEKIAYGGYSDVWRGTLRSPQGKVEVAIKELRVRSRQGCSLDPERLKKRFYREVILWDQLRHPNIVPLLGFAISSDNLPWLISPWYWNGNIVDYLSANPQTQRPPLLLQIANALHYLHSRLLFHGDLKGDNILIDANGTAALCDFGMSEFIDDALRITGFTTTTVGGGSARFLCPELLDDGPKTTMTDIWAFGCVAIQVMADLVPYGHIASNDAVRIAIMLGQLPLCPDYEPPTDADIPFWKLIRQCWNADPLSRPNIKELLHHIQTTFPSLQLLRSLPGTQNASTGPAVRPPEEEKVPTNICGARPSRKRRLFSLMKVFPGRNGDVRAGTLHYDVPEVPSYYTQKLSGTSVKKSLKSMIPWI